MKIILLKKLILLYTALLALMSPKLGSGLETKLGAVYTEVPPEVKTEYAYLNFKNGQEKIRVQATKDEYLKLGIKDAVNPVMEGYVFTDAILTFSTSTPILQDYQYYKVGVDIASSTLIMIKLPNEQPKIIYLNTLTQ